MATRTTDKELYAILAQINLQTENRYDFSLSHAYGGVRLESRGGSRDVSPRLSKGELAQWMHAFLDGLSYATKAGYYVESPLFATSA